MKIVNVYEARGQFSKLLDEAEAGEQVVIARNGKPVVRLVPVQPPVRRLGRWQGKTRAISESEWRAADETVASLFEAAVPRREGNLVLTAEKPPVQALFGSLRGTIDSSKLRETDSGADDQQIVDANVVKTIG